ncbi:MAG: hypothetical protein AB7P99_05375 [Vicinamibacterales bacterium]
MNRFICRFYGRFVMAATGDRGKPELTFLMPNMQFRRAGLREHRALMTIARHHVAVKPEAGVQPTTFAPTYRTMAGVDPKTAEQFVWDLRGWTIDTMTTGGVPLTFAANQELVDLGELEQLAGRPGATLDRRCLKGSSSGAVHAAIKVGGGSGHGRSLFRSPPNAYVALDAAMRAAADGSGQPEAKRAGRQDIDIIEVTLPPGDRLRISATPEGGGPSRQVTVDAKGDTVIAFTNLCVCLPEEHPIFDMEFAQYYNVLEQDAVPSNVLIPAMAAGLGYDDCDNQAEIWY